MKPLQALAGLLVVTFPAQAQTAADTDRIYSEEQLSVVPVVLRQPAVVYPDGLKRAGIGGTVTVSVVLDRKGHPDSMSVRVVSSPDTELNGPARAVVLGSRFTAGHLENRDVRTQLTLSVLFDPLDTARAPAPIYGKDDSLTEKPVLVNNGDHPKYPVDLQLRRIEGRVVVQMIIDTLGRPELQSIQFMTLPDPGFMMSVTRYLAYARFLPARSGGRRVRCIVYLPIDFKLGGSLRRIIPP